MITGDWLQGDDLCAIIVIALFYSSGISFSYLGISLGIFGLLCLLNRLKINHFIPYRRFVFVVLYAAIRCASHHNRRIAGFCHTLPAGLRWKHLPGAGLLGGIGFTMSIFVTLLAFENEAHIAVAKIAVITASVIASLAGLLYLGILLRQKRR